MSAARRRRDYRASCVDRTFQPTSCAQALHVTVHAQAEGCLGGPRTEEELVGDDGSVVEDNAGDRLRPRFDEECHSAAEQAVCQLRRAVLRLGVALPTTFPRVREGGVVMFDFRVWPPVATPVSTSFWLALVPGWRCLWIVVVA